MSRRLEARRRSEEHTSELQSRFDLVCRLLLEKKIPLSDAQPAGEIPVVQETEKRLREALNRRQRVLVGETREQTAHATGRLDPLSVTEKLPLPEQHPGAQGEAQTAGAAQRGKSRGRARSARPREHRLRLGRRQVLSQNFFFYSCAPPQALHSFPTRRSSD